MNFIVTSGIEGGDFPESDLSPGAANMAAAILSNEEMLRTLHAGAEDTHKVFRYGHPMLELAFGAKLEGPQLVATMTGIAVYEALTVVANPLVGPEKGVEEDIQAIQEGILRVGRDVVSFAVDAREAAGNTIGLACEVITEAVGNLTNLDNPTLDYALYGASTIHNLHLSTMK
jgi:hypothetical protein